jgi:two-component system, NtrC family, response regulator GlrR
VRELANVIEGAVLLGVDGVVRPQHIHAVIVRRPSPLTAPGHASLGGVDVPTLREARDAFDRAYVEEALRRAGGNVSAAARMAGRNRTDFHALLRRHGLTRSQVRELASTRRGRSGALDA